MQQWEYAYVDLDFSVLSGRTHLKMLNGAECKEWKNVPNHVILNSLGLDGWELAGVAASSYKVFGALIFKRPLVRESPA